MSYEQKFESTSKPNRDMNQERWLEEFDLRLDWK